MKRGIGLLAGAVVLRMAFHAVYLPAFEGPDEPQHLARIWEFARRPLAEAFAGREVAEDVLSAVAAYPCRESLHRMLGCPPYGEARGTFDLLRSPPALAPARPITNVEANQPPLFYALAGWALAPLPLGVPGALLFARVLAVACVAVALFGPLRSASARFPPGLSAAGLLALMLPGASEGLARCSNEAAVFLWASLVLAALERPWRPWAIVLLLAAGPAIKLTAIPIVVFAVVALAEANRVRLAAAAGAASLLVFPLQAARGWLWGGTLELNFPGGPTGEAPLEAVKGFLRSVYAFVKTTFWVGGFSLLRPPRWLTAAYGVWLAALALAFRRSTRPRRWRAHAAGLLAAAAGFTVFAIANRRYYGDWGGVGGWYLWGWSPWLAVAAADLATLSESAMRPVLWGGALFVLASNAVWFAATLRLYG
jgi:hypothetical protein